METSESNFLTQKELLIFLNCSTLFVVFLFFIDEGYYSFESVTKVENKLPFVLYPLVALVGQPLLSKILSLVAKKSSTTWVSAIAGPLVSVGVLIAILLAFK